jgi:sugar phosphate isomerase/epimerase
MLTRREFLRQAGVAVAAIPFVKSADFLTDILKTGLMLYTVRDEMAKDMDSSLKIVSDIGYNWIETSDYNNGLFYNLRPSDFRKKAESYGLKWVSGHFGINESNLDKVVADASGGGLQYVVLPSLPVQWRKSADGYRKAAGFFNLAGEKCKNAGIKFAYHNHKFEFKHTDGLIPYDLLISRTDPDLVTFEIDTCWLTAAGQSVTEYMRKYPGRFDLFHLKDMSAKKKDATLGEGILDFKPIFGLTEISGMKYFFVEQDNVKTNNVFESIRLSRDFLLHNFRISIQENNS